jgi:two-component system cell cycle sensor histidine kinase/response regulator CckA
MPAMTDAIRSAKDSRQFLIEHASDVIYACDGQGRFTFFNGTAVRIMKYAKDELLGRHFTTLIRPDYREEAIKFYGRQFMQRVTTTYFEFPAVTKDGHEVWFGQNVQIMFDRDQPIGFQAIARDITERRALEDQLRQAQKMEAVGRLAGGIAHDFNNLLTSIIGYTDLIRETLGPSHPSGADLGKINEAGQGAAVLVRQLLTFSRKQILDPVVVDLNGVLTSMEPMIRRTSGDRITLELQPAAQAAFIRTDLGQLEQVIMNLVTNAVDAMPDGGKLVVAGQNVERQDRSGHLVRLTVTDTGTGMAPEIQARVFEPFFTTKSAARGAGLGLSMVYGVMKQGGGQVTVHSTPGAGSTFTLDFPALERKTAPAPPPAAAVSLPNGSETILVVEDNESVRQLACRSLERFGYSVLKAQDGEEALEVSANEQMPIELLLTDMVMPGIGGAELAQRIVQQRPAIHVLYMSGYTEDAIAQQGILLPGISFLPKPFTIQTLARRVRETLDRNLPL